MPQAQYNEKRKAIIDNSIELFFSRGFDNVNLQAMLKHASVSKGTFYHYFKSKDELVDACYLEAFELFHEEVDVLVNKDDVSTAHKVFSLISWPSRFSINVHNTKTLSLIEFLRRPGNQSLRQLFESRYQLALQHPLEIILLKGCEKKEVDVRNPAQTAALLSIIILPLIHCIHGQDALLCSEPNAEAALQAGLECIERTLKFGTGELTLLN